MLTRSAIVTVVAAVVFCLVNVGVAAAHDERPSFFPNYDLASRTFLDPVGQVPTYRRTGPSIVVCATDSKARINEIFRGPAEVLARGQRLALLRVCDHDSIQSAVNDATNGTRILILPGVYTEPASRAQAVDICTDRNDRSTCTDPDPRLYTTSSSGLTVPSYEFQRKYPTAQNLIAIIGDNDDADRKCDDKCNLQIEGLGKSPHDVLIKGDRKKFNVIRADRADGIYLKNFEVELSDFNNIYVLETNGFRIEDVITHDSREYGILSFVSDHGLYSNIDTYRNGDSGIYPGAGPEVQTEGGCGVPRIELNNVNSHDNTMGYSGTSGNGIYVHDSRFHDNATGIATDSAIPGHPGMPQDCAKFESNLIYSNNKNSFSPEMDEYCKNTPYAERTPDKVCPSFVVPEGTGLLIVGGNRDLIRGNQIWNNWRWGTALYWVPKEVRPGDDNGQSLDIHNPFRNFQLGNTGLTADTSHFNRYVENQMSAQPHGARDPNGTDFFWSEEGFGNCWSDNTGGGAGRAPTSDPTVLPSCDSEPEFYFNPVASQIKQAELEACGTWNPIDNTDPPGCTFTRRPKEPR